MYIDLKRIEYVITDVCSGRCKHCSAGKHTSDGGSVDADAAVTAIKRLTERFKIESVMTFGGEPLLYAEAVSKIHAAAIDCGIPEWQIITNGYFSRDERKIEKVAEALCASGVNDGLDIVDDYDPYKMPVSRALLNGGVAELLCYAETMSVAADTSQSPFGLRCVPEDNGCNQR